MTSSEQELDQSAVTEEELDDRRERIAQLHAEIAAEEARRSEALAGQERAIQVAQLDTEIVRLERQLAQAKAMTKVEVAQEGASGPLAKAKAELKAAEAEADAVPANLVDTNAKSQPEDTTGATVAVEVGSTEEANKVTYETATSHLPVAQLGDDDNDDEE